MRELSPFEWAVRPLKKYAAFNGRAPRAEYWWFNLATIIAGMVTAVLDEFFGKTGVINGILNLALLLPSLAVLVRRLHDTNRSGFWLLIFAVPMILLVISFGLAGGNGALDGATTMLVVGAIGFGIAAITLLVFTILPGTTGPNRYGPDPYGPDDLEEVFG